MRMTAQYSFGNIKRSVRAFVACPSPMGRRPETAGSSVPLCPAFETPRSLLTHATTSWLVGPRGLSSGIIPYSSSSERLRESGWNPNPGSVGSSSTTTRLAGFNSLSMVLHVIQGDRGYPPLVDIVGVDDKVEGSEVPPELDLVVFLVYLVVLLVANRDNLPALLLVGVVSLRHPARPALD